MSQNITNESLQRSKLIELSKKYAKDFIEGKSFVNRQDHIPPSGKLLDSKDIGKMIEAVLDGWLTTGRFNNDFEIKLAKFVGVRNALTTNSGSSANLLAVSALTSNKLGDKALRSGDEVITVAAGFPTTINPIIQNGLIPVFIDIDIPTYNIDTSLLHKALTKKTKAVMIAHTLGNPFNLDEVVKFAKDNNLWLIEDCCDALGAEYNGRKVGTFGDIATLSFYPAHHITTGEGGAVLTNSIRLKKIIESFRDWGRDCYCEPGKDNTCNNRFTRKLGDLPHGYDHKYVYSHAGFNLKMTDIGAACGISQLDKIDFFITKRRDNFNYLLGKLKTLEEFIILPKPTNKSNPSWFGFPITIKNSTSKKRLDLLKFLDEKKIGTRLLFSGNVIKQPYFKDKDYKIIGSLNNTDIVMNRTFWIGVQPALTLDNLDYVSSILEEFFLDD